jgi:hypothetical protein
MTSDASPLIDRLRLLCEYAQRAGADATWLASIADDLMLLIVNQRQADPRRRRSHAQAAQMAITVQAMRRAGHTHGEAVAALCRRHGIGRSWAYELLHMSADISGQKRR